MDDEEQILLTTVDNPYSPFTHWDEWKQFDEAAGYFTNNLLARTAHTSDELSEADYIVAVYDAMKTIANENVSGMHRLVSLRG